MTGTLVLDILTYWHPGTGRGDGVVADAVVHRGPDGLPFLPGRTVKGLVRRAARLGAEAGLSGLDGAAVEDLFGKDLLPRKADDDRVRQLEEARFATEPGSLRFGSARIGENAEDQDRFGAWACSNRETVSHLVQRIASTKIGGDGTAQDQTLRTIEVVVPVKLRARIDGPDDAPWSALAEAVELFLVNLGSHRNRGLGRVRARLEVSR